MNFELKRLVLLTLTDQSVRINNSVFTGEKHDNLYIHWVNINTLIEPTDDLLLEIELQKKRNFLENLNWENVEDIKINSVYAIAFGGFK